MKKLYRKGTVHPSPPPNISDHHLSFLPAAILTLTTALSPEDREVLAYLLSFSSTHPVSTPTRRITSSPSPSPSPSSSSTSSSFSAARANNNGGDHLGHPSVFSCDCFTCYTSYWVRWDASPNREIIHEIIDAYEDVLAKNSKLGGGKNKKERKNNKQKNINSSNNNNSSSSSSSSKKKKGGRVGTESTQSELASPKKDESGGDMGSSHGGGRGGEEAGGGGELAEERGSVRRLVNFIGERIWGFWN